MDKKNYVKSRSGLSLKIKKVASERKVAPSSADVVRKVPTVDCVNR